MLTFGYMMHAVIKQACVSPAEMGRWKEGGGAAIVI